MIKNIVIILFLSIHLPANTQPEIVGKTFTAHISTICEEFPDDLPCAGKEVYLVLHFEKGAMDVIEDTADGCGEITSEYIDGFPWKWVKDKHWVIQLGAIERVKHTSIENMVLIVIDGKLLGRKLDSKGNLLKEYHFRKNTN